MWKARHDAYFAAKALRPACSPLIAAVCVPIASLLECVSRVRANVDAAGLVAPIVGHVGDGNCHVLFVLDESLRNEATIIDAIYGRMMVYAPSVGARVRASTASALANGRSSSTSTVPMPLR